MKEMPIGLLLLLFLLNSFAYASPWAVTAHFTDRTIHTIDIGTSPPTVHGPFLSGQLGSSGHLYDVAMVPGGRYALVSNFELKTVYRIDLLDPENPSLAGSVEFATFAPVDIAVAPNGQFAVVSDGNSFLPANPPPNNQIALIDLTTFTAITFTLATLNGGSQAVAIAPDNQTVILCDRNNKRIIYGVVDPAVGFMSEATLPTGDFPINVAIAPDGQTVLVANQTTAIDVFRITAPGTIVAGATPTVTGLPGRQQSIAFAPDGHKAYVLSTTPTPHQLSWLEINGPGDVTLGGAGVANLFSSGTNRFIGVDVLAVSPGGRFALVSNPLSSGTTNSSLALVDLSTFAVSAVDTSGNYPVGLALEGQSQPGHYLTYKTKATKGEICSADSPENPGGTCQTEEDCGGSSSEEDETAFCVPNKFPKGLRVTLSDVLEPATRAYDVKKPSALCAPANKNGEGVVDPDTHLRAYLIRLTKGQCAAGSPINEGGGCVKEADCGGVRRQTSYCAAQEKWVSQEGVIVRNQFHTADSPLLVDVIKPDRLLVPTSKGLTDPVPPRVNLVDHYTCYRVAVPKGAPKFTPIPTVAVDDQFTDGDKLFDLKKPTRLCVAADKNGEGVVNPVVHLLCYQAKAATGQPKHRPVTGLFLRNQFGVEQADTIKEEEFCVPSQVELPGAPE